MKLPESFEVNNSRNLNDDPQFFAGFLVQARHNLFLINNHIVDELNKSRISQKKINLIENDENILASFWIDDKMEIDWIVAMEKSCYFLPLMRNYDEDRNPKIVESGAANRSKFSRELVSRELRSLLKTLNLERNYYSHNISGQNSSISDEVKALLKRLYSNAITLTRLRFQDVFEDAEYGLAISQEDKLFDENELTAKGLAFFTCLFLQRDTATFFLSNITGLKNTTRKEYLITRLVFMAYCVKLPQNKFKSQDLQQSLALDILNYLRRAPQQLYRNVSDDKKEVFHPELTQDSIENILENSVSPEELISHDDVTSRLTRLVRNDRDDKQDQLFLSFLSENKDVFEGIHFQVHLGKVILDSYSKTIGSEKFSRNIIDDLYAFDRISNLEKLDYSESITKPLILEKINGLEEFHQFRPKFATTNNKITLSVLPNQLYPRLKTENGKSKVLQPYHPKMASISLKLLPKVTLLELLQPGSAVDQIKGFINHIRPRFYDPSFIDKVKKQLDEFRPINRKTQNTKSNATNFYNGAYTDDEYQEIQHRKDQLENILQGYDIEPKWCPKVLLDYWMNAQPAKSYFKFKSLIKDQIDDCKLRLKHVEKYENDNSHRLIKVGEMASFLAQDINDMVCDLNVKSKITSFYSREIQRCLALLPAPGSKETLKAIFKDLKLYESGGHPFLAEVNFESCRYTIDFYREYLTSKGYRMVKTGKRKMPRNVSYLTKTFYHQERHKGKLTTEIRPKDFSKVPYAWKKLLNEKKYDRAYIEKWIQNNKEQKVSTIAPIPLTLFDDKLRQVLKSNIKTATSENKINKLYKSWWLETRKDQFQNFYDFERSYEVAGESISFEPDSKERYADYFKSHIAAILKNYRKDKPHKKVNRGSITKVLNRMIGATEKELRKQKEIDSILFFAFIHLWEVKEGFDPKLGSLEDLLNERNKIELSCPAMSSYDHLGKKLPESAPRINVKRKIVAFAKAKNKNLIYRYTGDRRLPEFFRFYEEDEIIQLDDIRNIFAKYNKYRPYLFDLFFQLEKAMLEKHLIDIEKYEDDFVPFKEYTKRLTEMGLIKKEDQNVLNRIRNATAHCQFFHPANLEFWGIDRDISTVLDQTLTKTRKKIVQDILPQILKL